MGSKTNTRRIFSLMDEMKSRGLVPGMSIYRYCVRAALFTGDIRKSLEFINIIRSTTRLRYDFKSWQAVATSCSANGMLEEEQILKQEIEEKRKEFSLDSSSALVEG